MRKPKTVRQVVDRLNKHHAYYAAGFYPSTGGRAFLARRRNEVLEISYDFHTFKPVEPGTVFNDHNGRFIIEYTPPQVGAL
jgi:hypothetical protein